MLINTVQEEDTQGVSSIQGASGDLVDADTGEDGNGTWDEAQAEFLERFESMPDESLQAQARSGAAWNFTLTPAEAERRAQQRNLKLSDIQAASPDSGSFTTAITSETSKQFSGLSSFTAAGTGEAGAQLQSMQMQMMQSNMTMFMQMLEKQQADFQKQILDMETRQKRELATMLQNQQTAQSSNARVVHPLSPNGDYRTIHPVTSSDQLVNSLVTALGQVSSNKSGIRELSKVKDTDDVAKILSKWSMALRSMDVHENQWVKKVLPCMIEGGNLHKWSIAYQPSMDLNGLIYNADDPKYIYNWTWDQLVRSLTTTGMWKRPDLQKNINAIHSAKCEEEADGPKIQQYIDK